MDEHTDCPNYRVASLTRTIFKRVAQFDKNVLV